MWGLIAKTKGLIMGKYLTPIDVAPVQLDNGSKEIVQNFIYLGSIISSNGELNLVVRNCISRDARVFGCLQRSIFQNCHLSTDTKRVVY